MGVWVILQQQHHQRLCSSAWRDLWWLSPASLTPPWLTSSPKEKLPWPQKAGGNRGWRHGGATIDPHHPPSHTHTHKSACLNYYVTMTQRLEVAMLRPLLSLNLTWVEKMRETVIDGCSNTTIQLISDVSNFFKSTPMQKTPKRTNIDRMII